MVINNIHSKMNYFIPGPQQVADKMARAESHTVTQSSKRIQWNWVF